MKTAIFCLMLIFRATFAVTHSLKYFYAASSGVPNFPEFVAVGLVDDVQMFQYDSNTNRAEPKQDWMKKVTAGDPQYWEDETRVGLGHQERFKVNIEKAKKRFNQTRGVHIFQWTYGCEWDDETHAIYGFDQYGYDGEDLLSFDLKTESWITAKEQALYTRQKWDYSESQNLHVKKYLNQICIDWLKKYVDYGRSSLMRTELPSVSLLQKSPSSPVRCHATGFYPDRATLVWRKDDEDLHKNVNLGETLPHPDGTFQMSADLNVASVPPEDWRRYDCAFRLSGVKEPIITRLDKDKIRTNWGKNDVTENPSNMSVIITAVVVVLGVVVLVTIGIVVYIQRNERKPFPPSYAPAESISSSTVTIPDSLPESINSSTVMIPESSSDAPAESINSSTGLIPGAPNNQWIELRDKPKTGCTRREEI